ncbi:GNAT family N-acetyltransferase [Deinococcus sp.]|uniref:GNAT family N-acetyltransferase n=1 Tax=Deinococcus sp. TaxID=47478 RepID=UPI003B5C6533
MNVRNDAQESQYELLDGDKVIGRAEYSVSGNAVDITHTEVEDGHEGEGLGSQIAKFALDDIRAQGQQVIPTCPFIAHYIEKHPEYQDLVSG